MPTVLAPLAVVLAALAFPSGGTARAFGPAESLTYGVSYLGIPVGSLQCLIGSSAPMDGRSVWPILVLARTDPLFLLYPMEDRFVSWYDPELGLSTGSDQKTDEKGKRRKHRVRYDREGNQGLTVLSKEDAPPQVKAYDVAPGAQDIVAAVYSLRNRPLGVGEHVELPIFTGARSFTFKATVERKERVEVPAGCFDAVALRVQVQFAGNLESKRDVWLYLSDDERHVPLRLDAELVIGTLSADLIDFKKGMDR